MKKVLRKTFKEKATDTGEDMKDARSATGLAKKEEEIKALAEELDEEGAKIDEFLKNRKAEMMAVGESKA
jgi:ribosomal protein L12E/L44/L45/RPP1/RPP2